MRVRLAVTPGEPAGIGPDILIQLAQEELPCALVAFADPGLLESRASQLGLPLVLKEPVMGPSRSGELMLHPVKLAAPAIPGNLEPANARYVLETLDQAIQACIDGDFDGLVTGPVQKSVINDAGIPFTGHTEYLAASTGTPLVVMMLATEGLRVALATTHLPLTAVPAAITRDLLIDVIDILHRELRTRFGIAKPRILVCGLNPHAGEGGHLGREEIEVIEPALEVCRQRGVTLTGPLPADTLFTPRYLERHDAVLAMYHDQGLPVLKYKGFGNAVNITLGLPFIRTSVDHGTALDLAGTGTADCGSLRTAVAYAASMASAGNRVVDK